MPTAVVLALEAFASIAKLIAQYRSEGTLTDQQLQDYVSAQDDETRKAAATFIQTLG